MLRRNERQDSERDTGVLYLRGLDRGLLREVKAAAARRGVTLTRFVAEALEAALRGPESGGSLPDTLQADQAWFERNRSRLARRFPGQYVAVVGGRVLDHDPDFGSLARRVFARVGSSPVLVQRCSPAQRVVRAGSPRVTRA
ncbi:MAG TPA: DUF5678 domain-containing protein [Actinomycetota bacterium]|nr:DUF5678 domain-containing protein [Actinomycetota bacterium]